MNLSSPTVNQSVLLLDASTPVGQRAMRTLREAWVHPRQLWVGKLNTNSYSELGYASVWPHPITDAAFLPTAFSGIDTLLLEAGNTPEARAAAINAVRAAVGAGVKQIVRLDHDTHPEIAWYGDIEYVAQQLGTSYMQWGEFLASLPAQLPKAA